MPRRWQQLLQHSRVGRRLIGGDRHGRDVGRADGPLQAPAGRRCVPTWGDEHRNDLAELVDGGLVDLDAALGQQLLQVAVRQRKAQLPPHGQHDHI
jgi:hypothetical protein